MVRFEINGLWVIALSLALSLNAVEGWILTTPTATTHKTSTACFYNTPRVHRMAARTKDDDGPTSLPAGCSPRACTFVPAGKGGVLDRDRHSSHMPNFTTTCTPEPGWQQSSDIGHRHPLLEKRTGYTIDMDRPKSTSMETRTRFQREGSRQLPAPAMSPIA